MPYLKWIESGVSLTAGDHPKMGTELKLSLSPERITELKEGWHGLLETPGSELRIDLPKGWTLFWKTREGDSRVLLAHPEAESWVGTFAIDQARAADLHVALDGLLKEGKEFRSSAFPGINRLSNLELSLTRG